jgi:hypothetical protein
MSHQESEYRCPGGRLDVQHTDDAGRVFVGCLGLAGSITRPMVCSSSRIWDVAAKPAEA